MCGDADGRRWSDGRLGGGKATRTADDHQGEAARDTQGGVRGDAQADSTHTRTAGTGDRAQHASHSGRRRRQLPIRIVVD